jgi:cyclopropane fatty-acyl-phospholipid synthase-like methyltransferase
METKWNKLHSIERFRPKYPTDVVVRFMFTQFSRNIKDRGDLKILDMGCGAGRHTIFLAREGFQAFGTDISEQGLQVARDRFKEEGLEGTLKNSNMQKQPFPDSFFDGVISFGVLYYNDKKGFENAVLEIYRILKKDGKALVFTRTTDDYRYGKGRQIEKNSFILDIEDTDEKDMTMHFTDREEINEIFKKFGEIIVEKTETTFSNMKKKNSDWIIIVKK